MVDTSREIVSKNQKTETTKGHLRWAALFLGELRDGLTMVRLWCAQRFVWKSLLAKSCNDTTTVSYRSIA
jgi:hypothetical protein